MNRSADRRPVLGAIDLGSNAARLLIGAVDARGRVGAAVSVRAPVRLGADVFSDGAVSRATSARLERAFLQFRALLRRHGAERSRAVATSAMREARNSRAVVARIRRATGIAIEVIDPREEARLVCAALVAAAGARRGTVLIVDLGGGSAQVVLAKNGVPRAIASLPLGAVRLLRILRRPDGERRLQEHLARCAGSIRRWRRRHSGTRRIALCLGTGGGAEAVGDLRSALLGRYGTATISRREVARIARRLPGIPVAERIRSLGLPPDRADIAHTAARALETILEAAGVDRLRYPRAGLKEGVLIALAGGTISGRCRS